MNRRIAAIAAAALAAIVAVGAVALATSDGATALTIDGHDYSQASIDGELAVLAEHPAFASGIIGTQLTPVGKTLPANAAASWLTIRVVSEVAADELARRDGRVTVDDRETTGLEGAPEFEQLPASFRAEVVERLATVRALQRVLLEDDPDGIAARAREGCATGRYVSHILVATLSEAQALQAQLAAGADFAEVARASSTDASAERGGELGCVDDRTEAEGGFAEPFRTSALTQALDVVSEPVQTSFGFHLILVTDDPPSDDLDVATITEVLALTAKADVDTDPRYGRWDARSGQVVPPQIPGT